MRFWLGVLLIWGATVGAEEVLSVRRHVLVLPRQNVTAAELVDSEGLSAQLQNQLSETKIAQAPSEGEKLELSNAQLTTILRPLLQTEREQGNVQLRITIPTQVVIEAQKHELDAAQVRTELLQAWKPLCTDCQLEVEALSLPRVDGIRDWSLQMKVELPRGSFSIPVELIRTNGSALTAWVSGRLLIKRRVPIARRAIASGERMTAKDFNWDYRDTSFALDGNPAADEISGQKVRQNLRVDDILWKGMIERERSVKSGEVVQIKSREGDWEVSLSAVAQQDGFLGDVIAVRNAHSNAVLMGRIVGQGEVELK